MRLNLDANAIVYAIEGIAPFYEAVVARLAEAQNTPAGTVVTSRLSRLECHVKPLRDCDAPLLAAYDEFFAGRPLTIVDVDADIIERATEIRVRYRFKTPDAIHLATALQQKADAFLTADVALSRCAEVKVELL
ncbi:MAG: PIN domain-containing protein [Tepidisphaeraceae bacterium]